MGERSYTLIYMAVLAAVLTAGVAAAHLLTQQRIAMNQALTERRVVLAVLGLKGADDPRPEHVDKVYQEYVTPTGLNVPAEDGSSAPVLAGHDDKGTVSGYAFRISGQGFWDVVKGYVAVSPDLTAIQGVAFFQQSETPGLGAEITKDWFQEQFKGKVLSDEPAAGEPVIRMVPRGVEPGPQEVHAVTGATGTSTAVQRLIDESLRAFLKAMRSRKQPGPAGPQTG